MSVQLLLTNDSNALASVHYKRYAILSTFPHTLLLLRLQLHSPVSFILRHGEF